MVKNHGGNKAKKQGRKFANASQTLAATRLSQDPDELYACCSKIFGNGKIGVQCHDGKERICIIRNKFRGRGKRGNTVQIGSWLLVGRRSFEKASENKKENTDLREQLVLERARAIIRWRRLVAPRRWRASGRVRQVRVLRAGPLVDTAMYKTLSGLEGDLRSHTVTRGELRRVKLSVWRARVHLARLRSVLTWLARMLAAERTAVRNDPRPRCLRRPPDSGRDRSRLPLAQVHLLCRSHARTPLLVPTACKLIRSLLWRRRDVRVARELIERLIRVSIVLAK